MEEPSGKAGVGIALAELRHDKTVQIARRTDLACFVVAEEDIECLLDIHQEFDYVQAHITSVLSRGFTGQRGDTGLYLVTYPHAGLDQAASWPPWRSLIA
ncbi:MAG: hypothetical protein NUV77_01650 [Thermoguttaceae bacterium]|nr:hypothetical protein [Thermoguttaceae bacterium]